jgi:hypothetical protein
MSLKFVSRFAAVREPPPPFKERPASFYRLSISYRRDPRHSFMFIVRREQGSRGTLKVQMAPEFLPENTLFQLGARPAIAFTS